MSTFMYFSFGSNLLRERILINNRSAKFLGIGKLWGYTFGFDTCLESEQEKNAWKGAGATIRKSEDSSDHVYGVIWELQNEDLSRLDEQVQRYVPLQVDVETENGAKISCRTYSIRNPTGVTLPSPHYKSVVVMGARQNNLPLEYISFLESFPDNGLTEAPPTYLKVMEMIERFRAENGTTEGCSLK